MSANSVRGAFWVFLIGTVLLPGAAAAQPSKDLAGNMPEQEIRANDLIGVSVVGSPEFSGPMRVSAAGAVHIPMVRDGVVVAGLMPAAAAERIARSLTAAKLLNEPAVSVSIVEYQSRPITVLGAVKTPITFQATGAVTLLEALSKAGGLREDAGSELLVRTGRPAGGRAASEPERIELTRLLDQADSGVNLQLRGGEEILVPEVRKVYVIGNVRKPGAFPVRNAHDATVMKMLALTEGLSPFASSEAYVYRQAQGRRIEVRVELDRILRRKTADVALGPEDILYVPDNRGRRLGVAAIERLLAFGSTAGATALIYSGTR